MTGILLSFLPGALAAAVLGFLWQRAKVRAAELAGALAAERRAHAQAIETVSVLSGAVEKADKEAQHKDQVHAVEVQLLLDELKEAKRRLDEKPDPAVVDERLGKLFPGGAK